MSQLAVQKTAIPGLLSIHLDVHGDDRGWFKENYQAEKLKSLGLPDSFKPVQNNISFNVERGVTRGIHAEPWNKYISVSTGKVFCAFVDLRPGDNFGATVTTTVTPYNAIYLPKGCGNSFQTLEPNTVYTYLVDEHWSQDAKYTMVNLNDKDLNIKWPIALEDATISDKDRSHPRLSEVTPMEVA